MVFLLEKKHACLARRAAAVEVIQPIAVYVPHCQSGAELR